MKLNIITFLCFGAGTLAPQHKLQGKLSRPQPPSPNHEGIEN
jgi:hypothetical protein